MWLLIFSAFTLGILGSVHCLGMCGPLIMQLPVNRNSPLQAFISSLFYHVGKTFTYAFFGIVAGIIGKGFAFFQWQQWLSIIAGICLLLLTFFPLLKSKINLAPFLQNGFQLLQHTSQKLPKNVYLFMYGILNGFLPCGLVYTALAASMVSGKVGNAVLFMIAFGMATIPSLSMVILLHQKISPSIRKKFSKSAFYLSVLMGVVLLLRGLNLGIPMVSPQMNVEKQEISCCHRQTEP